MGGEVEVTMTPPPPEMTTDPPMADPMGEPVDIYGGPVMDDGSWKTRDKPTR
jgi:hypothetical protein